MSDLLFGVMCIFAFIGVMVVALFVMACFSELVLEVRHKNDKPIQPRSHYRYDWQESLWRPTNVWLPGYMFSPRYVEEEE